MLPDGTEPDGSEVHNVLSVLAGKRPPAPDVWVLVVDPKVQEEALTLAASSYQRALLLGEENLSGSTLKGKAKYYGATYARSRKDLLSRMSDAKVPWREAVTHDHGRRILVLGNLPKQAWER